MFPKCFHGTPCSCADHVCGVPAVLGGGPPALPPHLPLHAALRHLRHPLHWGAQRVRPAPGGHHHQQGVSLLLVEIRGQHLLFRWICDMAEERVMCWAKIGILLHSLLNVYENVMVSSDFFL